MTDPKANLIDASIDYLRSEGYTVFAAAESNEPPAHTPTPWKRGDANLCDTDGYAVLYAGVGGKGSFSANLDFALRAVNAHDELVAALKDARISFANLVDYWGIPRDETDKQIDAIDAALAKARGEGEVK